MLFIMIGLFNITMRIVTIHTTHSYFLVYSWCINRLAYLSICMKNDSEIVVTNCGGASRTAFHETLCDIPVRVRRTSPFRLQISRVVSRDF